MKDQINVAICQMTSTNDVDKNVEQIFNLIRQIKKPQDTDLICFPENSLSMRSNISDKNIKTFNLEDPIFLKLSNYAYEHACLIHLGSVPLRRGKFNYNSSVIIDPIGKVIAPYDKMHLFDIQLEGKDPILESDHFKHGEKPATIDYFGWKMGLSICYDVRFSDLYSHYLSQKVDLVFIPSAFLVDTGKFHWEVLLRARAIETQSYVLAAAQGGDHGFRKTYGHSMVIDPWGNVLAEVRQENDPKVLEVSLKKSEIAKVRSQIPMFKHKRF